MAATGSTPPERVADPAMRTVHPCSSPTPVLWLVAIVLTLAVPAGAQTPMASDGAGAGRPSGAAAFVAARPVVDGDVLGDPAWRVPPVATEFWQERPDEGRPASERTEVRVIFTEDTLYFGVICYDRDPASIIVSDARRDASLDETDSFQIIIDTYRDQLNGFVFGTNPAGIEYDGQVTNEGRGGGGLNAQQRQATGSGGGFNINWDGAWEVRARITEIGWTAEFAVPFRTLRYPSGTDQTWGLNFERNIRRRNERAFWAPIPRQYTLYRLSLAGTLEGVRTPALRNLKITPYALANALESGEVPVDATLDGDLGFDLKYNLTPSLALDGTVRTDFAQVEVDDQQVNLDRFNLFFPEKRPFFLENAGFFSVGNAGEVELFFSRRIGIGDDGELIPILGGARVSGKAGKFNVGLLDMQTDSYAGTVPSNNFAVVRVSRDLPNRSTLGGIFVNRQATGSPAGDADYNRTFGVDGTWGIGQSTVLSSFLAKTQTPGVTKDDVAFNVRSTTNLPRVDVELGYQEVGDEFNPEVGFLSRHGYRKPDARVMTRFRPADFIGIQELRPHATYRAFFGFDGFQETGYLHLDNHWVWRNSYELHTGVNFTREGVRDPFEIYPEVVVPPGTYDHKEAQIVFMTNQGAPISLNLQTRIGGLFGGSRVMLGPTVRARIGETLTTELAYERNDVDLPGGRFVTNLARARISYSFTTRTFVQALVQYNDRADLWSMNLRVGWLQAANTGLFVVYTDTRGLYELYETPRRTDRSFIIKYSRMFDLLK